MMQEIGGFSVQHAVEQIIPFLEDTGIRNAHAAIYFDGWDGLAASAVLRAIAEDPPPSLKNKFDRIIHIDCTRWKSPRALQRAIVDELKLPQSVMAAFDREDDDDDYSGIDEGSRVEIAEVGRVILGSLLQYRCLVVFHNGSTDMVDLADFGIPPLFYGSKILWTFTGTLRINPETREKVDSSHLYIYSKNIYWRFDGDTAQLILEEATEVVKHMQHKHSIITPEIAANCITYILWLHEMGGGTMDYNWATHAANYWVCDGIIGQQASQLDDESWEASAALHKQMQRMEFSSRPVRFRGHEKYKDVWKSVSYASDSGEKEDLTTLLSRNLTSFFLVLKGGLPCDMFQQSERLGVLKLSGCRFSFNSPPFCCCHSLRFLGLDHCKHQGWEEEEDKQGRPVMQFFQSLWVLDINRTDWELDFSQTEHIMAPNIREVHIKKGRIWCNNLAWRQLKHLRKFRVIEPTSSWETGKKDEFADDMAKLELLDLSGNSTIQVLPSLSSASGLKTLILDGCVGLDHVGPEGLPPSLETFSLDARSNKLLRISLSGCAHLESFLLRGELPGLEELNLSGTSIIRLDLSDKVVHVEGLKKVFLMGCKQLRAILWWEDTSRQLEVLCIGTFEIEDKYPHYSSIQHRNYIVTADARFIQSLLNKEYGTLIANKFYLYLHVAPTSSSSKSKGSSRDNVITPKSCYYTYSDVFIQGVSAYDSEVKCPPLPNYSDGHMEVSEGISLTDVESDKGIKAIYYVTLSCIYSLHVHDNSCILAVTPKRPLNSSYDVVFVLKWCRVERCSKLETVFASGFRYLFRYLETIWVSDLPAAACIWSKGSIYDDSDSFEALQSIHLHECPRLKFALPLSRYTYLPRLETLHITRCGDLRQVFPWDDDDVVPQRYREAHPVKVFPNLKHVLLHDLLSLQEICEAKMTAPKLESVRIRGCWGLRRLPSVGSPNNSHGRPVVHCEKDWWTKLEWDGLRDGHHPSLYEPCYSSTYYKKRHLRGTVLR